jgi:putative endonuclease
MLKRWRAKNPGTGKGEDAEQFAAAFLQRQGLTIVDRNYRCRYGELDIIARDTELLVFAEVRLRNHQRFATGSESVDYRKQQKLILTAEAYLQQTHGNRQPTCRFDVVSLITQTNIDAGYKVEWLRDAFRPGM